MMRKKIFIIDECHRLSSAAWEGLLKMLEEPPDYAIFILCTTEPEKVTETVKTRCMTFDFRAISKKDIHARLAKIVESEKMVLEGKAVDLLARSANGSLRLGISRLEKLKHLDGNITEEEVARIVGMPCGTAARDFLRAVLKKDFFGALQASSSMISVGVAASEFLISVANLCHDILVCGPKSGYNLEDHGYTSEEAADVMELRKEIRANFSDKFDFRSLLRQWIRSIDTHHKMTVFNVQPQLQANYSFVDLCEIFHIFTKPRT